MKVIFIIILFSSLLPAQSFQSIIQKLEQTPVEKRRPIIERYLNSKGVSPIIEQDSLLHFVLYGAADSVAVNGNLQHWNAADPLRNIPCGEYSLFYRTYVVPPDARLDYTLIIDGRDRLDPQNPNITPSGFGPHSEVRMPKFVPSPYLTLRPEVPRGSVDSLAPFMQFPSPLRRHIAAVRPIKVYRPAGYDTLSGLPVVYVHDGFEAIDYAFLPRIMDNLIADGRMQPIIAVFIPPVDRGGEYMFAKKDQFVKYLADDLVPLIDNVYRTERSSSKRAMIGISAGAFISLYTILKRPDIFDIVGCQSSPMISTITELTQEMFDANRISPALRIYMDCGRFDIKTDEPANAAMDLLALNRRYSELLSSLRIPHYYKEANDGHEWASWRERIPEMLIYFFGKQ